MLEALGASTTHHKKKATKKVRNVLIFNMLMFSIWHLCDAMRF